MLRKYSKLKGELNKLSYQYQACHGQGLGNHTDHIYENLMVRNPFLPYLTHFHIVPRVKTQQSIFCPNLTDDQYEKRKEKSNAGGKTK
jgi:hypothetical protein